MYLEDITDSWKAEALEKIKGTQSQDASKRVLLYTWDKKRLVLFRDADSRVDSRNKVSLYLLDPLF